MNEKEDEIKRLEKEKMLLVSQINILCKRIAQHSATIDKINNAIDKLKYLQDSTKEVKK